MKNLPSTPSVSRDPRVRDFVSPVRLIWASAEGVAQSENLLRPDDSLCRLTPNADSPPGFVLDFGRELHGGIRLDIPRISPGRPARLRVRFGESVTEAMGTPNNDHAVHDHEVLVPWMGHAEVGLTGFRFVRIDLIDAEATVDISQVRAVHLYRDLPWLGSFECSDERLNAIWQTGAYTVHLCMQDYIWDGNKRDRLVWIGDLHPEAMVVAAVFGGHEIVPRTLDQQRDRSPLDSETTGGAMGGGAWMNGISSYSLWWILIQRDWYRRTGDRGYLREQRAYLLGLQARLERFVDEGGGETLDGHRFLEWPTSRDESAIQAGLQALMILSFQAIAEVASILGETEAAAKAAVVADRMGRVVRPTGSKQATALSVLAGATEAGTANESLLSQDPYRGLSTFYGYYVLEARARAGDIAGCLNLIRTYWGGMLDAGATTFWEGFDIDWLTGSGRIDEITPAGLRDIHADFGDYCYPGLRHSLCHGWAAGPTAWLSEHVLGVSPALPGFSEVSIRPNLGDLEWARGTVPTPYGIIEVEHTRRADGTVESRITLPEGIVQI